MANTPIVTGVDFTLGVIGKQKRAITMTLGDALEKAAGIAFRKSEEFVPRDTGHLAISGRVEREGRGLGVKVRIAYGSQVAYYALYVHEDLTPKMFTGGPPRGPKYIERAVRQTRGAMASVVRREITAGLRKYMGGQQVP